ncbi:MAG TPA: di-heme enzyme, partial [Candidatus Deferrimicrobium sp.]|nr:di-heme enzyme [Candidatus Deferrimicrobium sp.]
MFQSKYFIVSVTAAFLTAAVTLAFPVDNAFHWELPAWVPPPRQPADNPATPAKVELGRHLFYDQRLSADETMSCATCHEQARAFTDGKKTAVGITGEVSKRNSMALANVAYLPTLTWGNPQIESLEVQALIPVFGEHPVEMGMAGKEALLFERLKGEPIYQKLFADAFSEQSRTSEAQLYSLSTVTKAIAAFQRTLLSFNAPYDHYKYGKDKTAISTSAKRGEALFFGEKMECYHCHAGFNFTDNIQHSKLVFPEKGFHNTGLYNEDSKGAYPPGHGGIGEFTGRDDDMGKFRTPSLRNVALTAPYMHDGSIASLEEVIRNHYAKKGRAVDAGKPANLLRSYFIAGFQVSDAEVR